MRLAIEVALGLIVGLVGGAAAGRLLFPSYFERVTDWLDDNAIGLYWHEEHAPGHHGEGRRCGYTWGCGYWYERWWAPSKLWREKWCYLGLHAWCFKGDNPSPHSRDFWYVGYWWTGRRRGYDRAWRRFCAHCAVRRGTAWRKRPADVMLTCCPGCGITDYALASGHHHSSWCGGDDRAANLPREATA